MAVPDKGLDIVNLALLQLYQKPLTSLTDTKNKAAEAANAIWDPSRRSLLRNIPWNFACTRGVAPLVVGSAPAFDYLYFYQLPYDCIRVLEVGTWCEQQWAGHTRSYDIQGRLLLRYATDSWTTADPAFTPDPSTDLYYVMDQEDVTTWDALFTEAMSIKLARDLCMPVSGSADNFARLDKQLKGILAEAQAINHQERPIRVIERNPIAAARIMSVDGVWDVQSDDG